MQSDQPTRPVLPSRVHEIVVCVRDSGLTNMLAKGMVATCAEALDKEAADFIRAMPMDEYFDGIMSGFDVRDE